jgi:hypothetical protein
VIEAVPILLALVMAVLVSLDRIAKNFSAFSTTNTAIRFVVAGCNKLRLLHPTGGLVFGDCSDSGEH